MATSATASRRLRSERGSMLVEALVAAAIVLGGGAATIVAFNSTTRTSHTAERQAEAVAIAEHEMERLIGKPYAQIANCSAPSAGTGTADDPKSWVQGTNFFVARNFGPQGGYSTPPPVDTSGANRIALEPFVVSAGAGCVQAQDDVSTAGIQSDSKIAGAKVFRFITSQGQQCASNLSSTITASLGNSSLLGTLQTTLTNTVNANVGSLCSAMGSQQSKRVTIAVVLNQVDNQAGLKYPVYLSTLIPDAAASLDASTSTVISG